MSSKRDAIILEKNPLVAKQIERYFRSAGFRPESMEALDLERVKESPIEVFATDTYECESLQRLLESRPDAKVVLWTAEPLERTLRIAADNPRLSHILGRENFDSVPRDWELLMVLRRLKNPKQEGPKLAWFMNWGFTGFQETVDSSSTRDKVVHKVKKFILSMGARAKVAESFSEVAHELLMNAMYDAPVDDSGKHKYAHDRKSDITLLEKERPQFKLASDGSKLAIQVTDPFGQLKRERVFKGIERGLTSGEMDTSHGGAGLGMTVMHHGTNALFFNVLPGVSTEVTGIFELNRSQRDFRLLPKSLHYFDL